MNRLLWITPIFAFALTGCPAETTDTGEKGTDTGEGETGDTQETADTTDTNETGETGSGDLYNVSGVVIDFGTQLPVGEGLCVVAVDPAPAITGGEPTVLAMSTTASDGTYTISDITEKPTLGLVIIAQDCADEGTVFPTGTGIKTTTLDGVGSGETLSGQTSFSISMTTVPQLELSFQAAAGSWDHNTEGLLLGFVFDSAGSPIGGATVAGVGATTYYADTNPMDGFFTAEVTINTATDAGANALWAIPAAPITAYLATADGYTFDTLTGGSIPGLALFVAFFAS